MYMYTYVYIYIYIYIYIYLSNATCLLAQCGLVCLRLSPCQGSPQCATSFATVEDNMFALFVYLVVCFTVEDNMYHTSSVIQVAPPDWYGLFSNQAVAGSG